MDTSRRISSISSLAGVRTADMRRHASSGVCTLIRLVYGGR
jgi:hypothetical protein